jgi:hypothetical protein
VAAILVAGASFNLVEAVRFLETGRGKYLEAIADMAAVSATDDPSAAGNHDLGNLLAVEYYERYVPGQPSFKYFCGRERIPECELFIAAQEAGVPPPQFFIVASTLNRIAPPANLDISNLAEYTLMAVYPKYGLSGLTWAVYRSNGYMRGAVSRVSPVP